MVGLLDPRDVWHSQAVALLTALQSAGFTGIYFDCVISETVSTATRRLREKRRTAEIGPLLDEIIANFPLDSLTWVSSDIPALYTNILSLVRASKGELNFNDALIALACQEREIPFIASFDRDFDQIPGLRRLSAVDDVT